MKRKAKKILFRFVLIPLISLIILVCASIGILYSQQQRLVRLAVDQLNKQLPGKLALAGSELSVFQNWPYVSIGLKDVRFYPSKAGTDQPIYEAERMYIGFSLPDILRQQFHIKVIALKNGHLDLVQDNAGRLNIVEASRIAPDTATTSSSATTTALDLAIKKLVLKNIRISYQDRLSGQQFSAQIEKIRSAIQADNTTIAADLQGGMVLDHSSPRDTTLFRHKHLTTEIRLSYNRTTQVL